MAEDLVVTAAASVLPEATVDIIESTIVAPTPTIETKSVAAEAEAVETQVEKELNGKVPQVNGHTEQAETSTAPTDPPTSSAVPAEALNKDSDMVDVAEAEKDEPKQVAGSVGGNQASAKKTPNGASKKKSSVVPEHKSKKLNRKKSKPVLRLDASPGELYLARMKGHQPWPSIICDEEMLPHILLSTRPVTTALADGTFRKPEYAPGGKRESERTFPVMFLHTNEFAWLPNTELAPLAPEECKDIAEKGKSKSLLEAYSIAAEGRDLSYFKNILLDHDAFLAEDAERRAEREVKKANKAKRKSGVAATEVDADDMEVDEKSGETKPKSKKRKKSLENDEVEEKVDSHLDDYTQTLTLQPAKTPKTGAKLKLTTPKTPVTDSATKKKISKPKSSSKKTGAKATAASDDELHTPKVEEKPLTPAEAKEKKEKEIRYFRHKLQKGFITRDYVPGDEEIKSMSTYLRQLENIPDLEGSIIRSTKINKVLKAMIRLPTIPKDEEFNFKKRSQDLLAKWNTVLGADTGAGADKEADKEAEKETNKKNGGKAETNGHIKEANGHSPVAEKTEAAVAAEPAIAPGVNPDDLEKMIGTTAEGEKEAATKSIEPAKPAGEINTGVPGVERPAEEY